MQAERVIIPVVQPVADRNITGQYPIQSAAWIWHPDGLHQTPAVVRFRRTFSVPGAQTVRMHISADERFELFVDGTRVGMGPDRGDLLHWSFHTYDLTLDPGEHTLEALAWYLGEDLRPYAQISLKPGFILHAEGDWGEHLSTGTAAWEVARVRGIRCENARQLEMPGLLCVGPAFVMDGRQSLDSAEWVEPVVVHLPPPHPQRHGVAHPGWALMPSQIPEQTFDTRSAGTVRAVRAGEAFGSTRPISPQDESSERKGAWQTMLDGGESVSVPAGTSVEVIIDLNDYLCAYPEPCLSGGAGGELRVEWAETLYDSLELPIEKGDRAQVAGKRFVGFHDAFVHAGGRARSYRSLWWRCGRYIRLWAKAGAEDLVVEALPLFESRYPLEDTGSFAADASEYQAIRRIGSRGVQSSLHETYMDSPYYEQMMYGGDTRLQLLVTYQMTADVRPAQMAIEWFNRSRYRDGFVAGRYPTGRYQHIPAFSLIWVLMVRDFALYRDEPALLRHWMVGVRHSIEAFRELLDNRWLLSAVPGWPWLDWPNEWPQGVPPAGREGASAPVNLLFANALLAAADLEEWNGEPLLAERNRELASTVTAAVFNAFWDECNALLADDEAKTAYSEHAQSLALLTGLVDEARASRMLHALEVSVHRADAEEQDAVSRPDSDLPEIVRTTVYFSFYMHEAFRRYNRRDLYEIDLRRWRKLVALDLKTPVEDDCRPGARSDCHAWGAHPVHFFHTWYAGIEPAEPGFRSVRIAPEPGSAGAIACVTPHPNGSISLELAVDGATLSGTVTLPPGTPGVLEWHGRSRVLPAGETVTVALG